MDYLKFIVQLSALGFWIWLLLKACDWFVEWDTKRLYGKIKEEQSQIDILTHKMNTFINRLDAIEAKLKKGKR